MRCSVTKHVSVRMQDRPNVTSRSVARSPCTALCSANTAHLFPSVAGSPTSGKEQDTGLERLYPQRLPETALRVYIVLQTGIS